jgi:hypothetical protein
MSHHGGGGHAHGAREGSQKSHLPSWLKQLGVTAILLICAKPIIAGIMDGNIVGVILWAVIADLLAQFVMTWS